MNYLASILGYGDSLITLSVLEQTPRAAAGIRVIGTAVTKATANLMQRPPAVAEELFSDAASFYAVKERGISAALADILRFRNWARAKLSSSDTLILEKQDLRNRLLVPKGTCTVVEVPRAQGAYVDRQAVLRPFIGERPWLRCVRPQSVARRVMINPSARASARTLSTPVIEASLRVAATVGAEVCLIDVAGHYGALRDRVYSYLRSPPLHEAAAALRDSDRYIGPDSFFMHLAYYYHVPFLAFFQPHNMYFAPPGMIEQGNYVFYGDAAHEKSLADKFRRFLAAE